MHFKRTALRAIFLAFVSPVLLSAQAAKTTGSVAPNLVEFRIPLEQPAGATWKWNRAETPDNECEYMWQVAVPNGSGRYAFGFYLYKLPGAQPAHGDLQVLLKAGQASLFKENAQGAGSLIENAKVKLSAEDGRLVLRITDPGLIRAIFGSRPETVTINIRGIGADFGIVNVEYHNETRMP